MEHCTSCSNALPMPGGTCSAVNHFMALYRTLPPCKLHEHNAVNIYPWSGSVFTVGLQGYCKYSAAACSVLTVAVVCHSIPLPTQAPSVPLWCMHAPSHLVTSCTLEVQRQTQRCQGRHASLKRRLRSHELQPDDSQRLQERFCSMDIK